MKNFKKLKSNQHLKNLNQNLKNLNFEMIKKFLNF